MQSNYQFRDSITLVFDGWEFDLHNDYDFIRLEYSVLEKTAQLHWHRSNEDRVSPDMPSEIVLRFYGVSKFEFRPRNAGKPFTEDNCLSSFGYLSDANWSEDVFWVDDEPAPDWMQAFEFMSGAVIGLNAKASTAAIQP